MTRAIFGELIFVEIGDQTANLISETEIDSVLTITNKPRFVREINEIKLVTQTIPTPIC